MHPQLAGGAALVSIVFLEYGKDEAFFEFAHRLGIQNIAFIHLQDKCFELISHGSLFLSLEKLLSALFAVCQIRFGSRLPVLLLPPQQIKSLIKAAAQFRRRYPNAGASDNQEIRRQF
jgi:hypothetical protein